VSLFSRHSVGLQTIYSDLKRRAAEQPFLLIGTPGSVSEREVGGRLFLYRQFYDPAGKKTADYIGPAADPAARKHADAIKDEIDLAKGLLADARLLARQGYVRVDARTGAIVAALTNHGLFRAGATIVGSHAYGALLNELGARSAAHLTEDIDVARGDKLALDPENDMSFARMLEDSTISLSPIVGFDRKAQATSYKARGRDRLRVDLLVPTDGREVKVLPVPELKAHATALPHLRYLLTEPIDSIIIGRESVAAVKVPRPERLAWHKMLVSQLRGSTTEKRGKDIQQAAVLVAILAESDPGALESAFDAVPTRARTKTKRGAEQAMKLLVEQRHERASQLLESLLRARAE